MPPTDYGFSKFTREAIMVECLGIMLLTMGQWDVKGYENAPSILPIGSDRPESTTSVEISLVGPAHLAVRRIDGTGRIVELRRAGTSVIHRYYEPKMETDVGRSFSVAAAPDKNARVIGKAVNRYLGSAWTLEVFKPTGWLSEESYAGFGWYPMSGVRFAFGIRNLRPSVDLRINP